MEKQKIENNKPILISPAEAMKLLGVGRNMMYENLLKRDDFPAWKVGNKYFINRELLNDFAKKQCIKK